MDKITTIAVDLAKHVFELVGENRRRREVLSQRIHSRDVFEAFLRGLALPVMLVMEVGPGAQAWARLAQALGINVRLLPAQLVRAHRTGQKNDSNDARAILRAFHDESIHAVPVKSADLLAMQALHRARQGWVSRKTALSNQIRGLLLEHGVAIRKKDAALIGALPGLLEASSVPLPDALREVLKMLWLDWQWQATQIKSVEVPILRFARENPEARRYASIAGIGPITGTALVCKCIDVNAFANGRHLSAYIGIVPSQHSSGSTLRLGKMTRHGDGYIRALLINGAHAVLAHVKNDDPSVDAKRLQRWMKKHGRKGAAVRLANRNLRIVWSLLKNQTSFERNKLSAKDAVPLSPSPTAEQTPAMAA